MGLAFSDHADFQPINALYQELLNQSIRFPNVQSTEVELLKRMIPPLGIPGALRLAQPAANTSQFLQGIRENFKYASLNHHAFDDLLQNLARSPSDSIKRTQLQNAAVRLQGFQKGLETDIRLLKKHMDTKSESIQEEQATLYELIQVKDKIRDAIQQFQLLDRMCNRAKEEEEMAMTLTPTTTTSEAATATAAKPPGAQMPLSAAAVPTQQTNAAGNGPLEKNDVSRTLREAREALELFNLLQQDIGRSSAQVAHEARVRELQVVGERLVGLQKEFPALINARLGETDVGVIEAEETVLANLMGVNDELLLCIENYQRMVRSNESGLPLRRNCTRANHTSTGTGNRPVNSHYVSNALESVTEVTQSATNGIYSAGPSTSSEAQITAQFATMTMQDSPADDVRVSRNPIAPTIDPLKNANREFVNLLGERTQHDHGQVTPQLVMQIQSLQQLDTVQLPAENKLTGLSVEEFRLLIPLVLERVNTTVNSLHDLLRNANTPGFSAKDPDLVRIKVGFNFCIALALVLYTLHISMLLLSGS
ncbi:unnamed protein product [Schistocephalus solidus]|uniref:Uncharacterized protein n=1 Tax=Schistocephalus solidus TaxID=70667 RepID=A0A3P7CXN6_SCHSO|nr:unnamed protein product [Schistocephalus solidus]